ncbi:hypothetical protein [Mucilaginibacter sp.]|uniref:hypothetical protein n=1 Tax=Mucilaginibacter sp. TaxID=1882438 RepID=UPI003D0D5C39
MPFEKGKPKTGGRLPGVKNKSTAEIREAIQKVLADKVDELADDLASMNEFKQWTILNAVAKYVLPTLAKNEDTVEYSGEIKITVSFSDGDIATDYPTGDYNSEE